MNERAQLPSSLRRLTRFPAIRNERYIYKLLWWKGRDQDLQIGYCVPPPPPSPPPTPKLINLFPYTVYEYQASLTRLGAGGGGRISARRWSLRDWQHAKSLFVHTLLSFSLYHWVLVFISFIFVVVVVLSAQSSLLCSKWGTFSQKLIVA